MDVAESIPFQPTADEIDAMVNPSAVNLRAETEDLYKSGDWLSASENLKRVMRMGFPQEGGYTQAQCHHALADCAMNMGMNGIAITHYREALRHDPSIVTAHENLIFLIDSQPWTTAGLAARARRDWWTHLGAEVYATRQPHTNVRDPEKKLRVGYVSSDFRFHSAMISFMPVVFFWTEQIEPVFYSTLHEGLYDAHTQWVKDNCGANFVDVSRLTHGAFAEVIRQDQIDILVDLSGYTAGNRLLSFAHAPAPIRITAWGYATGVSSPAITHLFADKIVATPSVRAQLHETVVDLPCVIGFFPRTDIPEPPPLPCLTEGPRFAVFQRASKLNDETFGVWSKILRQVPESTILFKGTDYTPSKREEIVRKMKCHPYQIAFEYGGGHLEHQLFYHQCDLSLDPWPQTGGVSSMESCYQGVPVVTLIGDRVIQRTTASILTTLGLPDFICTTKKQYIQTAVDMVTTKRAWLNEVRLGLRARMQHSPIIDGYRDAVEAKYRELWREYCAQEQEPIA